MHKYFLIFLLFIITHSILPQTSNTELHQAEKLVMTALNYVQKSDWESYAKILDPDDTKLLKDTFNNLVQKDTSDYMIRQLKGIESREEFLAMEPAAFFPHFMRYLMTIQAGLGTALSTIEGKILGSVRENNLIHVLTRQSASYGDKQFGQIEVITVIKKNNGMYIKMKDDIRLFAERLRSY